VFSPAGMVMKEECALVDVEFVIEKLSQNYPVYKLKRSSKKNCCKQCR